MSKASRKAWAKFVKKRGKPVKVIDVDQASMLGRSVHCPNGGFVSTRLLLARDGMGFALCHTFIPKGEPQHWHYLHHLEACYCVSGKGVLKSRDTGQTWEITPGTLYALDKHDDHDFQALEDTVLISVFNPPLVGQEVHQADGSYAAAV